MRAEDQLQMSIVDYLEYVILGHKLVHSIPNEAKRSVARGSIMKRMGLKPGAADLVLIYDGRAHYMELKVKSPVTETQDEFGREACLAGAAWGIVRSIDDVERLLRIWNIPTRRAK